MRGQRGFTLIEFLAVTAISTIGLAIGVPAVHRAMDAAHTASALSRLTTSLAVARIESIRRNRPVSVCPSLTGRTCGDDRRWDGGWIVFEDHGRGQPDDEAAVIERAEGLNRRIAVSATAGRPLVRFMPDGWASGTNSTLRICLVGRGQLAATVVVNNAGRTRTERFSDTPCPFA